MSANDLLVLENPVYRLFLGHCALVLLKTCAMSLITVAAFYMFDKNTKQKTKDDDSKDVKKNKPSTENVDRVRRCHRNDLENVIPFVLLGLLYVATGPAYETARIHFRIFTISRFFHTVFYIFAIPQPSRAMVFFAGLGINISMAYRILTQALF
ncbi:microsomal glutathione S-transferase 1-like [Physella acuta]|uniref:microsomal glutathione S-transferase 1-like n=1 Tax=Physella acuta TaxID=109671 RepID=UPI0027DB0954|nr:microsomal glutathione S-transferase 1-like [Physella acuta]